MPMMGGFSRRARYSLDPVNILILASTAFSTEISEAKRVSLRNERWVTQSILRANYPCRPPNKIPLFHDKCRV